jgi:hypothetical protein
MRRTLCIAVAIVTIGCGGERNVTNPPQSGGPSHSLEQSAPASQTRSPATPRDRESRPDEGSASPGNLAIADQLLRLTGCLTGGEAPAGAAPASTATTGSPAGAGGDPGMNRFLLTHATPEPGGAGVGANGAGASGGPLVSGASDYLLQGGDIAELRGHLGHQVRISARLNTQQMSQPPGTASGISGKPIDPASAGDGTLGSGATRVPRAIPNSVPTSQLPRGPGSVQALIVESVQMVSATCAQP